MPYIAIVHVPDHTAVKRFVEKVESTNDDERLVGIFDFPNRKDLQCHGSCVRKGMASWSRTRQGFMKCNVCGYRPKKLRQWLIGHIFDLLGANLYENAPAAFRTPEGYGS